MLENTNEIGLQLDVHDFSPVVNRGFTFEYLRCFEKTPTDGKSLQM
jgi:hypothetical protein